ncbi:MAG: hypothetical protein IPL78_03430 [Chloroflexi bacterium]|nr:hypothetical protein [Chloroflexota bacterium]
MNTTTQQLEWSLAAATRSGQQLVVCQILLQLSLVHLQAGIMPRWSNGPGKGYPSPESCANPVYNWGF